MPYRRLTHSIKESLLRMAVVGVIVAGAWLVLQFYSEDEVVQGARDFWAWWSTRFTGDLAEYWNPAGAAISLGICAVFILSPISRLLGGRRRYGSHHNSVNDDYSDSGDSGGDSSD